jgi:DNA-binding protein Fis
MAKKDRKTEKELMERATKEEEDSPRSIIEDILRKDLENVVTVLNSKGNGKSTLYEEVMSIVDRSLFKIALNRSGQVKSTAATYLGVNRNTFQKKMTKLGMNGRED